MKTRLNLAYFGWLFLCAALLMWSLWSLAQPPSSELPPESAPPASTPDLPGTSGLSAVTERMLEQHRDVLTFGLHRVTALQSAWLGQPLWKYLAALLYLGLALASTRVLNWLITGRLRRWAARTATLVDDLLIEIVQGPIKVIVFVILLHLGLRMMTWSPTVERYISLALQIAVAWSLTYMTIKAVHVLITYWQKKLSAQPDRVLDDRLLPLLQRVITGVILIIAVLVTCDNLGIKITSILAGLSVGGLALGLAAQDTVANFIGAMAIFTDKPFQIGDRVQFDNLDGVVEQIGLRSTRIRNLDGHLITVPNKTIGSASITNISRRPHIRTIMNIGITYNTPAEQIHQARAILEEVYRSHPMTKDLWIAFDRFADFYLNIKIIHWWNGTDFKAYFDGMHELNVRVKERLDAAGIHFAFPTQTVYLRQDSDWRLSSGPPTPSPARPAGATG